MKVNNLTLPDRPGRRLRKAGMVRVLRNGCLLCACVAVALTVFAPGLSYGQPPPPYYGYGGNYYGYGQPYYQPNPYPYGYYYHPYGYPPAVGPLLQGLGNAWRQNVQPYKYNEEWQEHQWQHNPYRHRHWHGEHGEHGEHD